MAKISKSALKGLIKECLVEILEEGLLAQPLSESRSRASTASRNVPKKRARSLSENLQPRKPSFNPALDTPVNPPSLADRVPPTIARVSSDPSIQALLEDTAATTFQTQNNAENQRGPQAQTDVPLEALGMMGAKMGNWADMAFSESRVDPSKLK
jgi:hypothetical protein